MTCYYFYIHDRRIGAAFIKVCCYAPYPVKIWCNGHEIARRAALAEGIAVTPLANGFAATSDPARLQELCDLVQAGTVRVFFETWMSRIPLPLTAADRDHGCWWQLAMRQVEVSRTLVFDDPRRVRTVFEELLAGNMNVGRPENVELLFLPEPPKQAEHIEIAAGLLVTRLLRALPDHITTTPLRMSFRRRLRKSDTDALWRELARLVGLPGSAERRDVVARVVERLETQHVVILLTDLDRIDLEDCVDPFWIELADAVAEAQPARSMVLVLVAWVSGHCGLSGAIGSAQPAEVGVAKPAYGIVDIEAITGPARRLDIPLLDIEPEVVANPFRQPRLAATGLAPKQQRAFEVDGEVNYLDQLRCCEIWERLRAGPCCSAGGSRRRWCPFETGLMLGPG